MRELSSSKGNAKPVAARRLTQIAAELCGAPDAGDLRALAGVCIEGAQRLIVVVGPSGAGKDTVLQHWRALLAATPGLPPVAFVRRVITRPPDPQGEAHESVGPDEFARLRQADGLALEWGAHALSYGVRRGSLAPLRAGHWVVLNGSRQHLPQLLAQAPGARVVELTADAALLQQRLARRGREGQAAVQQRLQRQTAAVPADLTLHNDHTVADCVQALHRWWLAQPGVTPPVLAAA